MVCQISKRAFSTSISAEKKMGAGVDPNCPLRKVPTPLHDRSSCHAVDKIGGTCDEIGMRLHVLEIARVSDLLECGGRPHGQVRVEMHFKFFFFFFTIEML